MTCRHPRRTVSGPIPFTRTLSDVFISVCADCGEEVHTLYAELTGRGDMRHVWEWSQWQQEQARRARLPQPYRSDILRHGGEGDP
jgi:hypothetical protein